MIIFADLIYIILSIDRYFSSLKSEVRVGNVGQLIEKR